MTSPTGFPVWWLCPVLVIVCLAYEVEGFSQSIIEEHLVKDQCVPSLDSTKLKNHRRFYLKPVWKRDNDYYVQVIVH